MFQIKNLICADAGIAVLMKTIVGIVTEWKLVQKVMKEKVRDEETGR